MLLASPLTIAAAMFLIALPAAALAEDDLALPATPAPTEEKFEGRASVERYFKDKGLPAHVAAGIADNVQRESGFDPTAKGDGGTSGGLFQAHNSRYRTLLADIEMDSAWKDLMGRDPQAAAAFNRLKNAKTEKEARDIFAQSFERCAACGAGDPSAPHARHHVRTAAIHAETSIGVGPGLPWGPNVSTALPVSPHAQALLANPTLVAQACGDMKSKGLPTPAMCAPYPAAAAQQRVRTYAAPVTAPPRVPIYSLPRTGSLLALASFLHHRR